VPQCATTAFKTSKRGRQRLAINSSPAGLPKGPEASQHQEDINVAVCVLPGTELCFENEVKRARDWPWVKDTIHHKTAIFRQVNLDKHYAHHDALEFPDGEIVLLTYLMEGQQATVLQLPATAVGSKVPQPLTYVLLPP
jgi:hypothetical protein